jgi:hypothetical protein
MIRKDIIKELEQIPDELLPDIARILDAIRKEHMRKPIGGKKSLLEQLTKVHKKVRALTAMSKISWSNEVIESRMDRV